MPELIISPQSGIKNLATGPFIMQQQLYRSLCSQHLTFTINVFIYCHYILYIFLLFWCELYNSYLHKLLKYACAANTVYNMKIRSPSMRDRQSLSSE
jgi:hypothetical protein